MDEITIKPKAPASGVNSKLVIKEGQHYDVEDKEHLPFRLIKILGTGGYAYVTMVEDVISNRFFACKVFHNIKPRNFAMAKSFLVREMEIIRKLSKHHHMVKVFASYFFK